MEPNYFCPLLVNVAGRYRVQNERDSMPAHTLVIRPLLAQAERAYVYRGTKEPYFAYGGMQIPIDLTQEDMLIFDKGKFRFDLAKECVLGHEYLWNAIGFKRGSMVVVAKAGKIDLKALFRHTSEPGLLDNPNSWNTASATKLCRSEAKKGHIAFIFSASNGIENMCVYAQDAVWEHVLVCASEMMGKVDR